jgi:DNA adenine methylase
LVIRSFHGFGSDGHNGARPTGFRANSNRSGTTPAHDWVNFPDNLVAVIERLQGVVVESRPAMQVMAAHDGPDTLHYLDPPYVHSTRSKAKNSSRKNYRHEMLDDDHSKLLDFILSLKGMVVISGYSHPIYETALADGARERIEALWINPACADALRQEHNSGPLFFEVSA